MDLTTHDIITQLTRHGSIIIWAEQEDLGTATLWAAITAWRNNASDVARRRVAVELREAGVDARTLARVTGLPPASKPPAPAPPVSRAEVAADAAHIAKWGYV